MMKKYILLSLMLAAIIFGCAQSSKERNIENLPAFAQEAFRPQIHFSPKENWMNDPNGMVYYDGEYHLFYQYYPDSTVWGPMHWGHAISTDMVHWEELPIALYPDELGYIFSGSAVIDWNNTSGLQDGEHPPMIAIFTHHNIKGEREEGNNTFQYQSIAYSNDKGRTWSMYEGNPVVPNPGIRDFRDPKVSWHEATGKWVMIFAAADRVRLYSSPNLIDWDFESEFGADLGAHGGVWECPDLFPLQVEGTDETKWVMLVSINPGGPNGGSATQYFVGDFDGKTFTTAQNDTKWLDYGRDNYAGVTWSDIPEEDGRRLFIGWMSNWDYAQVVPTESWRSAMTLPRSLHLLGGEEFIVASRPVKELKALEDRQVNFHGTTQDTETAFLLSEGNGIKLGIPYKIDLQIDLDQTTAKEFKITLDNPTNGDQYFLNFNSSELISDRRKAGKIDFAEKFAQAVHKADISRQMNGSSLQVEIYVDASSIEVFLNNGELVMTEVLFPTEGFASAFITPVEGNLKINSFSSTELKSIW